MPVLKYQVAHKFGIISQSHREDLLQRILAESRHAKEPQKGFQTPLEIAKDVSSRFNNANGVSERDVCREEVRKTLERSKRRLGLTSSGEGPFVELNIGWVETSLLAQCKDLKIQEECLDVLHFSLKHSPIESNQIPAMFYLAELILEWLKSDGLREPFLRSVEIKLLIVGYFVFLRLFYFNMIGELNELHSFKKKLLPNLANLDSLCQTYRYYPNVSLYLHHIIEVGRSITTSIPDDGPEDSNAEASKEVPATDLPALEQVLSRSSRSERRKSGELSNLSTNIHDLSPLLWHSLDVWRCVNFKNLERKKALMALVNCGHSVNTESWIDTSCAFMILANAAQSDLAVLESLQKIAVGDPARVSPHQNQTSSPGVETDPTPAEEDVRSTILTGNLSSKTLPSGFSFNQDRMVSSSQSGMFSWRWETAVLFTELLGEVILHGDTSKIRSCALLGLNNDSVIADIHNTIHTRVMPSCGLLDVARIFDSGSEDWSWHIRYSAVLALSKIMAKKGDDGLELVSWEVLGKLNAAEKDLRVLEAFRVGKVCNPLEQKIDHSKDFPYHVAAGLSDLFLPRQRLDVAPTTPSISESPRRKSSSSPRKSPPRKLRTALKDELHFATDNEKKVPDFVARTDMTLMKVVEDQWRKELHRDLEDDMQKNEFTGDNIGK